MSPARSPSRSRSCPRPRNRRLPPTMRPRRRRWRATARLRSNRRRSSAPHSRAGAGARADSRAGDAPPRSVAESGRPPRPVAPAVVLPPRPPRGSAAAASRSRAAAGSRERSAAYRPRCVRTRLRPPRGPTAASAASAPPRPRTARPAVPSPAAEARWQAQLLGTASERHKAATPPASRVPAGSRAVVQARLPARCFGRVVTTVRVARSSGSPDLDDGGPRHGPPRPPRCRPRPRVRRPWTVARPLSTCADVDLRRVGARGTNRIRRNPAQIEPRCSGQALARDGRTKTAQTKTARAAAGAYPPGRARWIASTGDRQRFGPRRGLVSRPAERRSWSARSPGTAGLAVAGSIWISYAPEAPARLSGVGGLVRAPMGSRQRRGGYLAGAARAGAAGTRRADQTADAPTLAEVIDLPIRRVATTRITLPTERGRTPVPPPLPGGHRGAGRDVVPAREPAREPVPDLEALLAQAPSAMFPARPGERAREPTPRCPGRPCRERFALRPPRLPLVARLEAPPPLAGDVSLWPTRPEPDGVVTEPDAPEEGGRCGGDRAHRERAANPRARRACPCRKPRSESEAPPPAASVKRRRDARPGAHPGRWRLSCARSSRATHCPA